MDEDLKRVNLIPCVKWVKRGVAAAEPDKVKLSEEEMKEIIQQTGGELKDAVEIAGEDFKDYETDEGSELEEEENINVEVKEKNKTDNTKAEESDLYDFENYDAEDDTSHLFGIGNLVVHDTSGKDPYITLDDSDDSERDDDIIKPEDNLIVVGHVSGETCILEVYVHNESEGSLYVHHDVLLPVFPLCLEWLNYDPGEPKPGNYCAVGSMSPIIDIWDLDVINSLEPAFRLGNKAKKKKGIKQHGHRDAVLDISWNSTLPHILASGSVDQTVLLWDLDTGKAETTLSQFEEKVSSLKWHPFESQLLLTGCCDKLLRVFDCRIDDSYKSWEIEGEIERVLWNHFNPYCFLAGTDNGIVYCVDCRTEKPLWQLAAHHGEVSGLSLSSNCPGMLVTTGSDKKLKVWDISESFPVHVTEKKPNMGAIQCLDACPDSPFVVCLGGEKNDSNFQVIDLLQYAAVQHKFSSRALLQPVTEDCTDTEVKVDSEQSMDSEDAAASAFATLSLDHSHNVKKPSSSYVPGSAKKKGLKTKKKRFR